MDKAALVDFDLKTGADIVEMLDRAKVRLNVALWAMRPSKTPPLMIFRMTDPFIVTLRRLFAKTASVDGTRLGGHMIGDRYRDDGYVYRIK